MFMTNLSDSCLNKVTRKAVPKKNRPIKSIELMYGDVTFTVTIYRKLI